MINYKIRQQDGTFQEMTCPDTQQSRLFVEWVRIHDGALPGMKKVNICQPPE